jgi:hypothetical protein
VASIGERAAILRTFSAAEFLGAGRHEGRAQRPPFRPAFLGRWAVGGVLYGGDRSRGRSAGSGCRPCPRRLGVAVSGGGFVVERVSAAGDGAGSGTSSVRFGPGTLSDRRPNVIRTRRSI